MQCREDVADRTGLDQHNHRRYLPRIFKASEVRVEVLDGPWIQWRVYRNGD
jgi:hypothetical protein